MVDPPLFPDEARAIQDFADGKGLRIEWLLVTHAHGDHACGMAYFPEASVIAHEGFWTFWKAIELQDRRFFSQVLPGIELPILRHPNFLVGDRMSISFARDLIVRHVPGHSPDGLMVELPEEGLWIAGDTVIPLPLVSSGSIGELLHTLRGLLGRWRGESIIPGHGKVLSGEEARKAMEDNINYLVSLREAVAEAIVRGKGRDEILRIPLADFGIPGATMAGLAAWIHRENLKRAYEELSGGA